MFKEGDLVVCIDRGKISNQITIGCVYKVVEIDSDLILIIDDEGELCPYFLKRFRLATLLEKELVE